MNFFVVGLIVCAIPVFGYLWAASKGYDTDFDKDIFLPTEEDK